MEALSRFSTYPGFPSGSDDAGILSSVIAIRDRVVTAENAV
jgi:hypothetical protein